MFAVIVGVGLGVLAAIRQNRLTDHVLRVVSLTGVSMPTFWLALVALYVFYFRLNWLPGTGRLDPQYAEPPHHTGFFTIDAMIEGQWATRRERGPPPRPARARARRSSTSAC